MPNSSEKKRSPADKPEPNSRLIDPAGKAWVWLGLCLAMVAILPVWPIDAYWWGLPGWAVWAVVASALTSAFINVVLYKAWHDPDETLSEEDHAER